MVNCSCMDTYFVYVCMPSTPTDPTPSHKTKTATSPLMTLLTNNNHSDFSSKQDLIDTCLASAHLPVVMDGK